MSQATANPGGSPSASQQDSSENPGMWAIVKQTFKDWNEDNAMRLAASTACYIMLALAPMIVITLKVLSIVLRGRTDQVVENQISHLVGDQGAAAIKELIANAQQPGQGTLATIVSLAIVAFSASYVFVSLQDALNTIWEVKPKPDAGWMRWVRKRFLSIGMVLGVGVLLLASMAVTALLHVIIDAIFGPNDAQQRSMLAKIGAYIVDIVVTIAVAWALFIGVFKILPDAKISWRDVWFGALVTAVLFKLGQIAMAFYFAWGSTTSAYGAFGSIVAVLLWAYYSSAIMFLGAEFTQVWARAHGRRIEPEDHAVRVTEEERAKEGIPSEGRVAAQAARKDRGGKPAAPRPMAMPPGRPYGPPLPVPVGYVREREVLAQARAKEYSFGAAGAAVGALAAGLATWYFATDKSRPTRKQAAAVQLQERLHAVEARVGRVSQLKQYLEQMDVKERMDRVEHEIHRAGRHIRAKETGRPLWAVRLGDLIGGRWSNV